MPSGAAIVVGSDEYSKVARGARVAAGVFTTAGAQVTTAIPDDAFGALGSGVAVAGNSVGGELARTLTRLSALCQAVADGVSAASDEFQQLEDHAVDQFKKLESELDR